MQHRIADACIVDENVYFFDDTTQALYEFSVTDHKASILAVYTKFFKASQIFYKEKKLYITSMDSLDLLIYDMNSGVLQYFGDHENDLFPEGRRFYDFHMLYENQIWSFPRDGQADAYYFNLRTRQYVKDGALNSLSFPKYMQHFSTRFSNGHGVCYWKAFYKTNCYMTFNIRTHKASLHELSDPAFHLEAICFDGNDVWATSADENVILHCKTNGAVVKRIELEGECKENTFSRLYCIGQYIILLPRFGEYVLFLNRNSYEMHRVYLAGLFCDTLSEGETASKMLICLKAKDRLLFFGFGINAVMSTDLNGKAVEKVTLTYMNKNMRKLVRSAFQKNSVAVEGHPFDLEQFIFIPPRSSNKGNLRDKTHYGDTIYHTLVRDML